jgi:excisionase family DNA binding protein
MHAIKKKATSDPPAKSDQARQRAPLPGVPRYLTVAEVAAMLSFKVGTIYQMVHQKRIPFRRAGRHLRFEASEIDAWTKSCADNQ